MSANRSAEKERSIPRTTPRAECLVCGCATVEQWLDLGPTALANKFLTAEELAAPEFTYPLRVGFCHVCAHVQLTERVRPEAMFEHYLYISSVSETLKKHLYDLSEVVLERYRPAPDDLVMDIGCNDATLLQGFRRYGVRTLGVDPATNLASLTDGNGIDRYTGFFNAETAVDIAKTRGKASIITLTNTFPHIPDLADFVEGIDIALKADGVLVMEMHYLLDLLEQGAFDTIYHEHVSYWGLRPLVSLFETHGMRVVDAERLPLHHGQLRVWIQRRGHGRVQAGVRRLLEIERARRLHDFETYRRFAERVRRIRDDLRTALAAVQSAGKRVAGYGAPAKGTTLLTFIGAGRETLEYIVDRSPLKEGLYTPGSHIPIVSPGRLLEDKPDYVLLLAWNFAEEILEQQAEYRQRGGHFIIPLPEVRVT